MLEQARAYFEVCAYICQHLSLVDSILRYVVMHFVQNLLQIVPSRPTQPYPCLGTWLSTSPLLVADL